MASPGVDQGPGHGWTRRLHQIGRWQHAPRHRPREFRLYGLAVAVFLVVAPLTAYLVVVSGSGQAARNPALKPAPPSLDYGAYPLDGAQRGATSGITLAATPSDSPSPSASPTPSLTPGDSASLAPAATGPSGAAPEPAAGPPAPPAPPAGPAPAAATFSALSGEACPQTAAAGYFRSGWADDWFAGTGGWRSDGCTGGSVHVPMSGDTDADDLDNVVVWWFKTAPVTRGTCDVSVYVPGTGRVLDSAGDPATYLSYPNAIASGSPTSTLTVVQTTAQGSWRGAGSVAITGGQLSVRMMTRGIDYGPGRAGAHLGASALRVSCRAT